MGLQERGLEIPKITGEADSLQQQEQQRESKAAPLQCPRCDSKNTKFCYYNNYSKLQPRHFCKACRRYWTHGGVLRDVPVGRSRKNKRLKTAHGAAFDDVDINSCSSTAVAAGQQQQQPPMPSDACPEALLHETLLIHPPQLTVPVAWDCSAGSYVESATSAALLLPDYFNWVEEPASVLSYGFDDMFDPFSPPSSSSCSSPLDDHARPDARLATIDGGSSSLQEDHAGNYLSCWEEVFDMVDLEPKPPRSE